MAVIGRRQAEEISQGLGACPCGDYALWYRETPPAASDSAGKAVSVITADQITENLCQGCYLALIPDERRGDWKAVPPRDFATDQSPQFDPCDVSDFAPENQTGASDGWD